MGKSSTNAHLTSWSRLEDTRPCLKTVSYVSVRCVSQPNAASKRWISGSTLLFGGFHHGETRHRSFGAMTSSAVTDKPERFCFLFVSGATHKLGLQAIYLPAVWTTHAGKPQLGSGKKGKQAFVLGSECLYDVLFVCCKRVLKGASLPGFLPGFHQLDLFQDTIIASKASKGSGPIISASTGGSRRCPTLLSNNIMLLSCPTLHPPSCCLHLRRSPASTDPETVMRRGDHMTRTRGPAPHRRVT